MKLTIAKKPFKGRPVGAEYEANDRQARLLVKIGRAQYLTRDMQAAPVTGPVVNGHVSPVEPEPAAPVVVPDVVEAHEEPSVETDSENVAWDASMHVASKLKNVDGTWRKKPGARAAS